MGRCRLLSAIISWLPLSPPEASGTGPAFPLFTRVLIGKAHSLLNYELDPQAMASQCFDLDRPEQSVYQSMSDIEEARAVAAHFLTLTERNQFEPRVAIRIYRKELEQCSIGLSVVGEVPGTTGYTPVDRMHFDLSSSFHEKLYNRGSGHTTTVAPAAPLRHRAFLAAAPAAGAPLDAR